MSLCYLGVSIIIVKHLSKRYKYIYSYYLSDGKFRLAEYTVYVKRKGKAR